VTVVDSTGPEPAAAGPAAPRPAAPEIRELDVEGYRSAIPGLVELALDAVAGGASINFLADATADDVGAWWESRTGLVETGLISPFVAFLDGRVVGSVLLIRSGNQNSPHRAEIAKVIVRRDARRRGIARALMGAAETAARASGRWLLVLDTVTGSEADAMYRSLGWQETGVVPDYALLTDGRPWPATFFRKDLR
jgi:GNAT superfamily N-acetyltransferase